MALENGSDGMVMPVTPMGGYGNGGFGYGDGGLFWIIILFLFAAMGNGWGNGFGGNGGGTTYFANDVQRGFDQSAIINNLNGINAAIANGFANAEISRCNNAFNLSNQMTTNAMAQQATGYQLQAAIADTKSSVLSENCEDRYQAASNTRDIINAINAGNQAILNQMNSDKLDEKNSEISNLRQQLNMIDLANSQNQQTAQLISALGPVAPVPAYVVPNPSGCNCNNYNYGCCG